MVDMKLNMLFHNVQGFAHADVLTTISKPVKQRHFMATNGTFFSLENFFMFWKQQNVFL